VKLYKAADEVWITVFFQIFRHKMNEHVVISKRLTYNFADLVTSGARPDVTRGPPVVSRSSYNHGVPEILFR